MHVLETYIAYGIRKPIPCISVFITLIPLLLIVFRKAYIDPSLRMLMLYLGVKLLVDLAMLHSASFHQNNIVYFNLSIPIYYGLLSAMFYYQLDSTIQKRGIIVSMWLFLTFCIWDITKSNANIFDLHNHRAVLFAKTIEGVLIIVLILLYFYDIIRSLKIPNLLIFPFFWVCSGLLLYYSSFIFIAPALHYTSIWNTPVDLGMTRILPYIFEILSACLFSIGIYYFSQKNYAKQ